MSGEKRISIMAGAAVVLACFGFTFLEKRGLAEPEADLSRNPEFQREYPEESSRAALLTIQREIVKQRIDFSRRVARELIDQRLALREAANQLQNLDQSCAPVFRDFYQFAFRQMYPGRSEGERYCRRALALVENELALDPAKCNEVIRRLNQEVRSNFDPCGEKSFYELKNSEYSWRKAFKPF
jgi:hypothetical protein